MIEKVTHKYGNESGGQLPVQGNKGGKGSAPRQRQQRRDVRDGDALDRDGSRVAIAEAVFQRRRLGPVLIGLKYPADIQLGRVDNKVLMGSEIAPIKSNKHTLQLRYIFLNVQRDLHYS